MISRNMFVGIWTEIWLHNGHPNSGCLTGNHFTPVLIWNIPTDVMSY